MNQSNWDTEAAKAEYNDALRANADRWVVACGGTERPYRDGRGWVLRVWNPARGKHGYLNLGTDIVEEDR